MNFGGKPFAVVAGLRADHVRGDGVLGRARQRGHRHRRRQEGHGAAAAADGRRPAPPSIAFVLWISATDPKWNAAEAERFVTSLGADDVRLVDAEGGAHA